MDLIFKLYQTELINIVQNFILKPEFLEKISNEYFSSVDSISNFFILHWNFMTIFHGGCTIDITMSNCEQIFVEIHLTHCVMRCWVSL